MRIGFQSYECSKSKNIAKMTINMSKDRMNFQCYSFRATHARYHKGRTFRKRQLDYLQYNTIDSEGFL